MSIEDISRELTQRQQENKSLPLLSPFFSQLWKVAEEAQQYFPKPGGPTRQQYSFPGQIAWALCWQMNKTTNMSKKTGNMETNVKLNRGLVWVSTGPNQSNSCSRCKNSPLWHGNHLPQVVWIDWSSARGRWCLYKSYTSSQITSDILIQMTWGLIFQTSLCEDFLMNSLHQKQVIHLFSHAFVWCKYLQFFIRQGHSLDVFSAFKIP